MAYIFVFLCSAIVYYCIYSTPSMTECSGFHSWFHKKAISFSFKLMNLIAVCHFCKLDRCVQLKEEIKGKAGGPESFGCDRVNSSWRTVLTSIAARAQREAAAPLGTGSQEPRGTPTLAMLSPTGHRPTGPEHGRQSTVLVRGPNNSPRHGSEPSPESRESPVRSSWRWGQRQGWRQGCTLGPKSIRETGPETGYNVCARGLTWRQAAHTTESTVHPVDRAGDRHSYNMAVVV